MGATVGGIFGFFTGLVVFVKTKQLLYIPITTLSMAASFGFFLGVGTIVRSDNVGYKHTGRYIIIENGVETEYLEDFWRRKFRLLDE